MTTQVVPLHQSPQALPSTLPAVFRAAARLIVVNGRLYMPDDHGKLWVYQTSDDIFANGFQ